MERSEIYLQAAELMHKKGWICETVYDPITEIDDEFREKLDFDKYPEIDTIKSIYGDIRLRSESKSERIFILLFAHEIAKSEGN